MLNIDSSEYVPSPTVYGDILGIFTIIMCFAFAWQAINSINLYANLRSEGKVAQGYWTASYDDPFTQDEIAAYSFVVDDKTYRGKQPNHTTGNQFDQGEDVSIIYWVADPDLSRVLGTEGYRVQNLIELFISIFVGILALQFLVAYHLKHPAWIFILYSLVRTGSIAKK